MAPAAHSDQQVSLRTPAPRPGMRLCAEPPSCSTRLAYGAMGPCGAPLGPGFPEAAAASHGTPVLAAGLAPGRGSARPGCSGTGCGRAWPPFLRRGKAPSSRRPAPLAAGLGPAGPADHRPRPLWAHGWGSTAGSAALGAAVRSGGREGATPWMPLGTAPASCREQPRKGLCSVKRGGGKGSGGLTAPQSAVSCDVTP